MPCDSSMRHMNFENSNSRSAAHSAAQDRSDLILGTGPAISTRSRVDYHAYICSSDGQLKKIMVTCYPHAVFWYCSKSVLPHWHTRGLYMHCTCCRLALALEVGRFTYVVGIRSASTLYMYTCIARCCTAHALGYSTCM